MVRSSSSPPAGKFPRDVREIASGRVGLATSAWKRLLAAIGAAPAEGGAR